jgi:alpha-aminoadipate carrier protein LysW
MSERLQNTMKKDRPSALCPECEARITVNPHPRLGQTLVCHECDADLEIISIEPLEFDWAYDWSDGEWDEEEDDEDY